MRARSGLGMELHRARVQLGVVEALDRAVVERHVRGLASLGRAHGEAVVLARHEHAARAAVDDRMVRAAVAERELEGLVPGREREQLVAQADPEYRHAPDELGEGRDLALERLGVAGAVREQHGVVARSVSASASCG